MNDDLPQSTIRALGAVLLAIFDIALDGTRDVLEHLRPLVEPPEDLRVTGSMGVLYSGVVIIEAGRVIAGIVLEVGRVGTAGPPPPRAPLVPPARYEEPGRFEDRGGRLPGWAEDPRDLFEEEERWRRR